MKNNKKYYTFIILALLVMFCAGCAGCLFVCTFIFNSTTHRNSTTPDGRIYENIAKTNADKLMDVIVNGGEQDFIANNKVDLYYLALGNGTSVDDEGNGYNYAGNGSKTGHDLSGQTFIAAIHELRTNLKIEDIASFTFQEINFTPGDEFSTQETIIYQIIYKNGDKRKVYIKFDGDPAKYLVTIKWDQSIKFAY